MFSETYTQIFSRHITAPKIYLPYIVYNIIENNIQRLTNEQIRGYGLAKFFFVYLIGELMQVDTRGNEIFENPKDYVKNDLGRLKTAILKLWELLTPEDKCIYR